jgi:large subunit ribosomal protein L18
MKARTKEEARMRRKVRIRRKVKGTPERPRLVVFRSARHIYAQVVDDEANAVLCSATTMGKAAQDELKGKKKTEQAKKIGAAIAGLCKAKGIESVVFDRNGYKYHGRVMALAGAAREAGLKF